MFNTAVAGGINYFDTAEVRRFCKPKTLYQLCVGSTGCTCAPHAVPMLFAVHCTAIPLAYHASASAHTCSLQVSGY